jgi:hypothetical protein
VNELLYVVRLLAVMNEQLCCQYMDAIDYCVIFCYVLFLNQKCDLVLKAKCIYTDVRFHIYLNEFSANFFHASLNFPDGHLVVSYVPMSRSWCPSGNPVRNNFHDGYRQE